MKFLIPAGHEGTTGATSGSLIEEVLTEQLSEKIAKILRGQGHEAVEPDFNLYDAVNTKMDYVKSFDYVLEVHFNAFNGLATGTEIYVADGVAAISVEQSIMQRLSKWFKLRDADGVKTAKFKTLMALKGKVDASLLEVGFIDSKADMATYLNNIDKIAQDIAYGVLDGFGVPIKDLTPIQDKVNGPYVNESGERLYFRAIAGSYQTRAEAQAEVDKLGKGAWLQAVYVKEK